MEKIVVNCFCTDSADSGNPAAIILDFYETDEEKQKLAKQLRLPVTVFINNIDSATPSLRFFYPDTEMNLCLHGALAAAHVIMNRKNTAQLVCSTSTDQKLHFLKSNENILQIKVFAQPCPTLAIDPEIICKMLNLKNIQAISMNLPITVASVGSPKLLVPLQSYDDLAALNPNFEFIKAWSLENKINGLYVYTKENNLQARGFNPKTGHNEDAATGVAAAALALILKEDLVVMQGQFINKPSLIHVHYIHSKEIYVGGKTRVSVKT